MLRTLNLFGFVVMYYSSFGSVVRPYNIIEYFQWALIGHNIAALFFNQFGHNLHTVPA